MSVTEKTLEVSFFSSEFESQALVITVPKDYNEAVSPKNSLSDLSPNATRFTEVKNS